MINKKRLIMMAVAASMVLPTNLTYLSTTAPVFATELNFQDKDFTSINLTSKDGLTSETRKVNGNDQSYYALPESQDAAEGTQYHYTVPANTTLNLDKMVVIDKDTWITVEEGATITSSANHGFNLESGNIKIDGKGTIELSGPAAGASLICVENPLSTSTDGKNPTSIQLDISGVTLNATDSKGTWYYGIALRSGSEGAQVTLKDLTLLGNSGLTVNGKVGPNIPETVVNVGSNVKIGTEENPCLVGIYEAGVSTVNLDGCTIIAAAQDDSAVCGVEIRAGKLNISGNTTITATSDSGPEVRQNGNGSTTYYAGVGVAPHKDGQDISVNITGGTISGPVALVLSDPQTNSQLPSGDATFPQNVNLTVNKEATLTSTHDNFSSSSIIYTEAFEDAVKNLSDFTTQKVKFDETTTRGNYNSGTLYKLEKIIDLTDYDLSVEDPIEIELPESGTLTKNDIDLDTLELKLTKEDAEPVAITTANFEITDLTGDEGAELNAANVTGTMTIKVLAEPADTITGAKDDGYTATFKIVGESPETETDLTDYDLSVEDPIEIELPESGTLTKNDIDLDTLELKLTKEDAEPVAITTANFEITDLTGDEGAELNATNVTGTMTIKVLAEPADTITGAKDDGYTVTFKIVGESPETETDLTDYDLSVEDPIEIELPESGTLTKDDIDLDTLELKLTKEDAEPVAITADNFEITDLTGDEGAELNAANVTGTMTIKVLAEPADTITGAKEAGYTVTFKIVANTPSPVIPEEVTSWVIQLVDDSDVTQKEVVLTSKSENDKVSEDEYVYEIPTRYHFIKAPEALDFSDTDVEEAKDADGNKILVKKVSIALTEADEVPALTSSTKAKIDYKLDDKVSGTIKFDKLPDTVEDTISKDTLNSKLVGCEATSDLSLSDLTPISYKDSEGNLKVYSYITTQPIQVKQATLDLDNSDALEATVVEVSVAAETDNANLLDGITVEIPLAELIDDTNVDTAKAEYTPDYTAISDSLTTAIHESQPKDSPVQNYEFVVEPKKAPSQDKQHAADGEIALDKNDVTVKVNLLGKDKKKQGKIRFKINPKGGNPEISPMILLESIGTQNDEEADKVTVTKEDDGTVSVEGPIALLDRNDDNVVNAPEIGAAIDDSNKAENANNPVDVNELDLYPTFKLNLNTPQDFANIASDGTYTHEVGEPTVVDISDATVKLSAAPYYANSDAKVVKVTVPGVTDPLAADTDYTVDYVTEGDKVYVVVKGVTDPETNKGYTGEVRTEITISKRPTGGNASSSKPKPKPEEPAAPVVGTPTAMYRLYNRLTGEHLFTTDKNERDNLLTSDTWKDEGQGWTAPSVSDTPVYRLLNPNTGDHHYTTDKNEFDTLPSYGWVAEGIAFFSADKDNAENVILHRLYNPNATGAGSHHYTADTNERDTLVAQGWKYEGTAWAGLPAGK